MAAKSKEVATLEDSLRDFIIDEYQSDPREKDSFNPYKYKGLIITIGDVLKSSTPSFSVQIGMLEAEYDIGGGKKIGGSLGGSDERLVENWLNRGQNKKLLRLVWEGKDEGKGKRGVKIKPFDT